MRERVAIVFMTLNVVATLAIGGALAYEFGHSSQATASAPVTSGVAGQAYTSSPSGGSGTGTPSSGASYAAPTPTPSGAGTPGTQVVSNGATPVGHTASVAKTSSGGKTAK